MYAGVRRQIERRGRHAGAARGRARRAVLAVVWLLTGPAAATSDLCGPDGPFDDGRFESGDAPVAVDLADLDGDGVPDVVAACRSSNAVAVHRGGGDGSFGAPVLISTVSTPTAVCVADGDLDGTLDLITTSAGGAGIGFHPGIGDGAFGRRRETALADSIRALDVADVDDDGVIDVIVGAWIGGDSGRVTILRGDGTGTFATSDTIVVPTRIRHVGSHDVDCDGVLDVVFSRDADAMLHVAHGRGDGTFGTPTELAAVTTSGAFIFADLDLDGIADLITGAASPTNRILTAYGVGDGTFVPAEITSIELTPGVIRDLGVADVSGDGIPDIVCANGASRGVISITRGEGERRLSRTSERRFTGLGISPIALGDLDLDGLLDIVVGNEGDDTVHRLLGPHTAASAPLRFSEQLLGTTVVDVDGDGVRDLIAGYLTPERAVVVRRGDGAGRFDVWWHGIGAVVPDRLATGDLNHDGRTDLVTLRASSAFEDEIEIWLGDAAAVFRTKAVLPVGVAASDLVVGDVTGDGADDILVINGLSHDISLFVADGRGGVAPEQRVSVGTGPADLKLADVDGDGDIDVMTSHPFSSTFCLLRGDGAGGFGTCEETFVPGLTGEFDLADVNDDGATDIVALVEGAASMTVRIMHGFGDGSFSLTAVRAALPTPGAIRVADVNADDLPDLLVVSDQPVARAMVLPGIGGGGFTSARPRVLEAILIRDVHLEDVDGDDAPDLIVTSVTSSDPSTLAIRRNGCGGCSADLDRSRTVDGADLALVLSAWGPCVACPEDLDGDGVVTFSDLLTLLDAWGACPG